jgi:hypothetical protein
MKRDASDNARVASTREVDCWENEGGADRAPHQEDSDPANQSSEMRHFGGRVTYVKRNPKNRSPKKPPSGRFKDNS